MSLPRQSDNRAGADFIPSRIKMRRQANRSSNEAAASENELGIAGLVLQNIAGGTLVLEKSIFFRTLVSETEEKLHRPRKHLPDLRSALPTSCVVLGISPACRNNIDSSVVNVASSFQDLLSLSWKMVFCLVLSRRIGQNSQFTRHKW